MKQAEFPKCLIFFCLLLAGANNCALAADSLNPWLYFLLEEKQQTPQQIAALPPTAWQSAGAQVPNLDYSSGTLWLRLDIPADRNVEPWLLEIRWPFYDSVELFELDDNAVTGPLAVAGDHHTMSGRHFASRFPLFEMHGDGQPKTLLLRLRSGGLMLLPVFQWQINDYIREEQRAQIVLGLFYGTLLLIMLYNLGVWLLVHDHSHLFYAGYVFTVALYQASLHGVGFQYLWQDSLFLADKMLSISVGCTYMFGALFFSFFLGLKKRWPRLHRITLAISTVYLVGTLVALWLPEAAQVVQAQVMGVLVSMVALGVGIIEWRRGNLLARYFTIAWIFLLTGTCIYTAALADLVPYNRFTELVQSAGIAAEVVLLSLALGVRLNLERQAGRQAIEMSLHLAQQVNLANQETIHVQEQAKAQLEEKVQQRTAELANALTQLEQVNATLASLSVTDPLTGLKNRRYFEEQFAAEFQRALREQSPLSLLVLDLDHFKQVNDRYGHPAGDECLRQAAAVVMSQCRRPGDMAVRLGGEEMLLLLPGTDTDGARVIAETVRARIDALEIQQGRHLFGFTTSVGLATVMPTVGDTPEQLLALADTALYRAKGEGRNRVAVAGS